MNVDISKITESIAGDLLALGREVLDDFSLRDSCLYKNMSVTEEHSEGSVVVSLLLDNYAQFVETGRKPRSGRKPPIDALRDWALSHNIPTDNPTLWAISTAIERDGYEARPILSVLEQRIESYVDNEYPDKVFEALTEIMNKYFE